MLPLWRDDCIKIDVCDISKSNVKRVWFQIIQNPTSDAIERVTVAFTTFMRNSEDNMVLHVQHCASADLEVLKLPEILTIVGRLMEHKELIDKRLLGTVVQCTRIDDSVRFVKDLFLGMYTPRRPFDIVDADVDADAFLAKLVFP